MKHKVDRNKIRGFGIFSTLFLSLVGFGVFTYSQNIGKILGNSGFFLTFVYGLIYMFFIMMIYRTVKLNKYKNFEDIVENLFGKIIGRTFLFLISFFIIFLISIQLRIFIDSIKVYILPNINSEFMIIITLLVCYYVSREGDKVLPGLNEIMFVFLSIFCLIILVIVYKNLDVSNILPLELKQSSLYAKGFLTLSSYFSGGIILFYLLPMYKTEEKSKIHVSYKSTIFSFVFLAFVFLLCVSILNINQTVKSVWPIILAFTTVDVPGGFVERVEGIIITIAIIFFIMNFVNLYFYASYINSKSLGAYKHKISSTMFIPVIYVLTLIPQNLNDINFIMNKLVFPISIFISFFVPTLLFLASYIKNIFKLKGGLEDEKDIA